MQKKNGPLVSVVMITYAHENYIKQAIEGVLMQEYQGEIELIVSNDKSPDATDEVIKKIIAEHPNGNWIKYTNHTENLGMMPNFIWALQQAKGEYIAACEGDDYWIDTLKLQKQVDFLKNNADFIICGHWKVTVDVNGTDVFQRNDARNQTPNLSTQCVLFKNNYFKSDFYNHLQASKNLGETFIYHYLSQFGNYKILPFYGAAYRFSDVGVYSMISHEKQIKMSLGGCTDMQAFFVEKQQYSIFVKITLRKAHFLNDYALLLLDEGKFKAAIKKNILLNKELFKLNYSSVLRTNFLKISLYFYFKLIRSALLQLR